MFMMRLLSFLEIVSTMLSYVLFSIWRCYHINYTHNFCFRNCISKAVEAWMRIVSIHYIVTIPIHLKSNFEMYFYRRYSGCPRGLECIQNAHMSPYVGGNSVLTRVSRSLKMLPAETDLHALLGAHRGRCVVYLRIDENVVNV